MSPLKFKQANCAKKKQLSHANFDYHILVLVGDHFNNSKGGSLGLPQNKMFPFSIETLLEVLYSC